MKTGSKEIFVYNVTKIQTLTFWISIRWKSKFPSAVSQSAPLRRKALKTIAEKV